MLAHISKKQKPLGAGKNPRRLDPRGANPLLTQRVVCATIRTPIQTPALDSRPKSVAESGTEKVLDDSEFFLLVERLARLSAVDFSAVVQAAVYRRRFEEQSLQPQCANERAGS